MSPWKLTVLTLATVLQVLMPPLAAAQSYPERPVRFILPFPPGGSADSVARDLADRLKARTGDAFLIENKPGAAGNLATGYVVRAPNDGHTLLVGVTGALAINPELYRNLGYRPEIDLTPISMLAQAPVVVVASRQSGITSMADLVKAAKANPGRLSYATNGVGTSHHLAGEMFRHQAGISMVNVPYNGTPAALQDIAGGRVEVGFIDLTAALPLITAGRIVGLATTGSARPAALPDLPTVAEWGFPGFEATAWAGLSVPRGTPAAVVERLHAAAVKAITGPVGARQEATGARVVASTPAQFTAFVEAETGKWTQLIRTAGIKQD